ncbi:MAG: BlaI/MecI/CopY family transcriptional regulator [Gemmatimonadota bacterium]
MRPFDSARLSRLERNILDAVYRIGAAPASEIAAALSLQTSEDSVRVTLGKLEKKGILTHRRDGQRHVYSPAVPTATARRSALRHLLDTYYVGSSSKAVLTLLDLSSKNLSKEELDEIASWIEQEREELP